MKSAQHFGGRWNCVHGLHGSLYITQLYGGTHFYIYGEESPIDPGWSIIATGHYYRSGENKENHMMEFDWVDVPKRIDGEMNI